MELKYPDPDPGQQTRRAQWSAPKVAFARYQPGLSPYLHYWQVLRARRKLAQAPTDFEPDAGRSMPDQMKSTLEDLLKQSLGS
ncbi:hypothetical protein [Paracoccus salsus]|uniref:hypothetical protein n=1 Tax=Paracoccus salsus TaxID=2911061 RepID=UPI001F39BE71|nr:hypothetical protein [Paracoccus salsus]MCF3974364.1 hypothetical protein [Paracoccus salsus]